MTAVKIKAFRRSLLLGYAERCGWRREFGLTLRASIDNSKSAPIISTRRGSAWAAAWEARRKTPDEILNMYVFRYLCVAVLCNFSGLISCPWLVRSGHGGLWHLTILSSSTIYLPFVSCFFFGVVHFLCWSILSIFVYIFKAFVPPLSSDPRAYRKSPLVKLLWI